MESLVKLEGLKCDSCDYHDPDIVVTADCVNYSPTLKR